MIVFAMLYLLVYFGIGDLNDDDIYFNTIYTPHCSEIDNHFKGNQQRYEQIAGI